MFENSRVLEYIPKVIIPALGETFKILVFSVLLGGVIGIFLGTLLVRWSPRGLNPKKAPYSVLDFIISMVRSFPTIIFIVAVTPLTRSIVGTSIGTKAAVVPLTITLAPVVARIVENSLLGVDSNIITAAKSFGANNNQIIWEVMFPEALPGLTSSLTMIVINALNATAIAGTVGGGGLGAVALNYGYQRFDNAVMYTVVGILFIIVITIQFTGNYLNRKVTD